MNNVISSFFCDRCCSVSDVVTKRLSGTNAGNNNASTSLNFMVTNTKGQSHMDKPKPSNVSMKSYS